MKKTTKMSSRKGNTISANDLILISTGKAMMEFADENMKNHLYKTMAIVTNKIVEAKKKGLNFITYTFSQEWE